jgi:hypothetical protein
LSTVEDVQDRFAAALKEFAELATEERDTPPFRPEHAVSPTEAATAALAILDAAGMEIFELHMWRSFGR